MQTNLQALVDEKEKVLFGLMIIICTKIEKDNEFVIHQGREMNNF